MLCYLLAILVVPLRAFDPMLHTLPALAEKHLMRTVTLHDQRVQCKTGGIASVMGLCAGRCASCKGRPPQKNHPLHTDQ